MTESYHLALRVSTGRPSVTPRDFLDLPEGNRRQVRMLGGGDAVRDVLVLLFKIYQEVPDCAAFAGGVADENDRRGVLEPLRDTIVELLGFGDALTSVVGFLSVFEVAEKAVWIFGFEMRPLLETTGRTGRLEETCASVIDQQYRHLKVVPG